MDPPRSAASLEAKRREYRAALARFETESAYRWLGWSVSLAVLLGQAALLASSLARPTGWLWGLAALPAALYLADLLNGLVHLVMDHADRYTGFLGPPCAAFHQHHQRPRYEDKPLWRVYIHESGFKLWLPGFLLAGLLLSGVLPAPALRVWAWVGILSSVAELSHYLCHNSSARWVEMLARAGLSLDKRRHARHHRLDNVSYAFLNGWSDPVLDRLASWFGSGYRQGTDLHAKRDDLAGCDENGASVNPDRMA